MLATKKCFIQVKLALVNSHDCYHATAFPLQIKITMLAIRTFLCNMPKRFSPTLLLNRTDVLLVIYLKFSTFIDLSIGYFSSVSSTVPFLSDHPSGFYYIDSLVPNPDDVHRRHKLSSLLPLMTSQDVQNSYIFL